MWEKPFCWVHLKKQRALEGSLMRRSVRRTVVLEIVIRREESNPFEKGLELMRLAMVLAVLLAFLDLGLEFWGCSWGSEQKYLNLQNQL